MVRRIVFAAAALCASAPAARADDHDTWADLLDPHGEEVRQIIEKAQAAQAQALTYNNYDGDPTGEVRARLLDDAYGMLRYARKLAPHNVDVLFLLGKVADDAGRTLPAIEALEAYVKEADTAVAEAHQRLGKLHLRLRHSSDAIRELRRGLVGTNLASGAASTVYLAAALAQTGRGDDATQLLADAVDALAGQFWSVDATTIGMALAVAYDRDEQLSAAFQILDKMQNALGGSYAAQLQQSITSLQFVPAIDQRYWQALLYESLGFLGEARAEWLNYAAGGAEAKYRDRALAHVAAIDKLRAEELAARKSKKKVLEPE